MEDREQYLKVLEIAQEISDYGPARKEETLFFDSRVI